MMRNALEVESKMNLSLAVQEVEGKTNLAVQAKDFKIGCIQAASRLSVGANSRRFRRGVSVFTLLPPSLLFSALSFSLDVLTPLSSPPSAHTQRVVLGGIFRAIVLATPGNDDLTKAIDASPLSKDEKNLILPGSLKVTMSAVNKALSYSPVRAAAWKYLGFDQHVPLPSLSGTLLYGDLSSVVHAPPLKNVFISDDSAPDTRAFFKAAAGYMNKATVEFSAAQAALEAAS